MTQPFGLQPNDLAEVMATFGVAEAQVRRDHAISHILAALSRHHREELIFFGGTASAAPTCSTRSARTSARSSAGSCST